MKDFLAVGCGGFLGAVSRYGLSLWAQRTFSSTFPVGTFTVNVLGCVLLGSLVALFSGRGSEPNALRPFLTVGFLGAFTTFSTFGAETVVLLREGELRVALASVLANVLLGLLGFWGGHALARGLGA